jgi:hypothetical protein
LRLAREGEQFGYAVGQRPMSAHRFIFVASRCSRSCGFARISEFSPAEPTTQFLRKVEHFCDPAKMVEPAKVPELRYSEMDLEVRELDLSRTE